MTDSQESRQEQLMIQLQEILKFKPKYLEGKNRLDQVIILDIYKMMEERMRLRIANTPPDKLDINELKSNMEVMQESALALWETQRDAIRDPKTGLLTSRSLEKRLLLESQATDKETTKAPRGGALLFIDLDYFKTINDTYGHQVGDLLLARVGNLLNNELRPYDAASRFGGDEIVVFLGQVNEEQAQAAAVRIFKSLNRLAIVKEGEDVVIKEVEEGVTAERLSVSMGVKPFDANQFDQAEIIREADAAVYQTKHKDRTGLTILLGTKDGKFKGRTLLFDRQTGKGRGEDGKPLVLEEEFELKSENVLTKEAKLREIRESLQRPLECVRKKYQEGPLPAHIEERITDLADAIYHECADEECSV